MSLDYRHQLRAELSRRQATNPRYSMRAFARTLGMSAGFLSKIFSGKRGLSLDTARGIASRLKYSEAEELAFCHLVNREAHPSRLLDEAVRSVSLDAKASENFAILPLESFNAIADWYHYAILELTRCRGFKPTAYNAAKRLGLSLSDASRAVTRLLELGLLRRKGQGWEKSQDFIATPTVRRSAALRSFHSQILGLAQCSLETQEQTVERDITGLTLPIDQARLPELLEEIKRFRRRIARLASDHDPDEVYQLEIALFRLTQPHRTTP